MDVGFLNFLKLGRATGADKAAQIDRTDNPVQRVDHIDNVKMLGQLVSSRPHIVNGFANRPELGQRHNLALDQTTRALFRESQALLDLCAELG